eukprot:7872891-Pyramimonas_sp.AAC.1
MARFRSREPAMRCFSQSCSAPAAISAQSADLRKKDKTLKTSEWQCSAAFLANDKRANCTAPPPAQVFAAKDEGRKKWQNETEKTQR